MIVFTPTNVIGKDINLFHVLPTLFELVSHAFVRVDRGNDDVDPLVRYVGYKSLKRLGPFDAIVSGEMLPVVSIPEDFAKVITIKVNGTNRVVIETSLKSFG
jgi:hypothetical protein